MIGAIEKVAQDPWPRQRPQPGKLRHIMTIGFVAGTAALAVFWLPDALTRQTDGRGAMVKAHGNRCYCAGACAAADRATVPQ